MKAVAFFTCLVLLSVTGFCQSSATEAKAAYLLAEEAFNTNDYTSTINYLEECEKKIGGPNSKILYLKIMAEMELGKTDPRYYDSLSKSIAAFEETPDNKEFNEEKALEVMKIKLKLKSLKEVGKMNAANAEEAPIAARFIDSMFASFTITPGLSEGGFSSGQLKKFDDKKGTVFYYSYKKQIGPTMVNVKNGVIHSVTYLVKVASDGSTSKSEFDSILKSFPLKLSNAFVVNSSTSDIKNYAVVSGSKVVSVTYVVASNEISVNLSDIRYMN